MINRIIIALLLLSLIAVGVLYLSKPTKTVYVTKTATKYDTLTIENKVIESKVKILEREISIKEKLIAKRTYEINRLKHIADSLELNIIGDTICLGVINAKDAVISTQDSTISELGDEVILYSRGVYELKKANQNSKEIINNLNSQIDKAVCLNAWSDKNKFWAWLFGIKKCK